MAMVSSTMTLWELDAGGSHDKSFERCKALAWRRVALFNETERRGVFSKRNRSNERNGTKRDRTSETERRVIFSTPILLVWYTKLPALPERWANSKLRNRDRTYEQRERASEQHDREKEQSKPTPRSKKTGCAHRFVQKRMCVFFRVLKV